MASRKVVVITGASAGVGRAASREFARRGAALGLLARGRDGLEGAAREVEKLGGRALTFHTDVADSEQVEKAAAEIETKLGAIDVWVNNAMVSVFSHHRRRRHCSLPTGGEGIAPEQSFGLALWKLASRR